MGIVFHKSCYHVPDLRTKALQKQRKMQGKPPLRSKLLAPVIAMREKQMKDLINEARVWAYALSLPTQVYADGDQDIQRASDAVDRRLKKALLGARTSPTRIRLICGRIARNVLVPGLDDLDDDYDEYFTKPPLSDIWDQSASRIWLGAGTIEFVHENCKDFQKDYPNARTWQEVRAVADPYTYSIKSKTENDEKGRPLIIQKALKEGLDEWQDRQMKIFLGLPKMFNWFPHTEQLMNRRLNSWKIPDPAKIGFYLDSDLIIVVPSLKRHKNKGIMSMCRPMNVLKLYPQVFYDEDIHMSL